MPAGTLAPQFWYQALDDAGVAVAGALVNFYATGTTTRIPAYADADLTTPLSNPQACDAAGRLVAYLSPTTYKVIVTTPAGVPLGPTVDPVVPSGAANAGLVGAALGDVFVFGGNSSVPVTATSYPSGAGFDKLHAGTATMPLDSSNLAPGTYKLEATGLVAAAATLSVALVNLSDGAPDTPIAVADIDDTTGETSQSAAITFAAGGTTKRYGIKTKITTSSGEAWGARLVRTA